MPPFALSTPVAFIIFNRPSKAARVFAEIAKARPPKLLVVCDGPRSDRPDDAANVMASRALIKQVDWPCVVLTNYAEVNLGCKMRVSSGLDWVFQQVEEAIILEDDCLPDSTFFRFCEEMLQRYRHDRRIGMISGGNYQLGRRYGSESYYFSKHVHIWGWATWRDRWQDSYDVHMTHWPQIRDSEELDNLVGGKRAEVRYWRRAFDYTYSGEISTWDLQWTFANWWAGRLAIVSAVNLISNFGFGADATMTRSASGPGANLPTASLQFPLIHPTTYARNMAADRFYFRRYLYSPLYKMIFRRSAWRRAYKLIMRKILPASLPSRRT